MTTANEMRDQILGRAEEDADFRSRLLADPKGTISSELGTEIPDGFNIVVHEDSATTAHLTLPPSAELTEADLEMVAGANLWNQKVAP